MKYSVWDLRRMHSRSLHGLAGKLLHQYHHEEVTDRQDWLLRRALDALSWQRERTPAWASCSCALCCATWSVNEPFDADTVDLDEIDRVVREEHDRRAPAHRPRPF